MKTDKTKIRSFAIENPTQELLGPAIEHNIGGKLTADQQSSVRNHLVVCQYTVPHMRLYIFRLESL
jgi:hypothetical protein